MSRTVSSPIRGTAARDATNWVSPSWTEEVVIRTWQLGTPVEGNDPALWRKDEFGAWIHRLDYGRRSSEFGWEIHEDTHSGTTERRLRPLQWQNHLDLLASETRSRVTADGLRNTRRLLP